MVDKEGEDPLWTICGEIMSPQDIAATVTDLRNFLLDEGISKAEVMAMDHQKSLWIQQMMTDCY